MLDQKEEAKFAELRDKCRELKVPSPPEIKIGLKVHDQNGILTFDDIQRGHSWLRNFYNCIFGLITSHTPATSTYEAGSLSIKDWGGDIRNATCTGGWVYTCAVGETAYGITLGTSDTAFSPEQYAPITPITSGNSSGQLYFQAQAVSTAAYLSKIWTATFSRIFNNNSGGSITVTETGLGTRINNEWGLVMERNVLAPSVEVVNGAQLTVTYEISMDFSAID